MLVTVLVAVLVAVLVTVLVTVLMTRPGVTAVDLRVAHHPRMTG
jgi:hypothetical protein